MLFVIEIILLAMGGFFIVTGSIGLIRFPDVYTRMHATGKCDTLGAALILTACMVHEGFSFVTIKLLFILVFIYIVNPTATHAIARVAHMAGVIPWKRSKEK